MSDCVLTLDAGTGSLRAAVFDLEGHLRGLASENWRLYVPEGELLGCEFDPEETWAALARAARRAVAQAEVPAEAIRAIAATSQRDGTVFVNGQGRESCCALNRDARAVVYGDEIAGDFGQRVFQISGRWPLGLGALERLWWFRRHRPQAYSQIAKILMISDWLTYRLCGAFFSEPTNASSSLLFDIHRRAWSAELADAFGYPASIFPPCVEPGTRVGQLRAAAAADLGLPEGIPVAMGAGDSQAAGLGCAALEDGVAFAIAGTTLPIQMVLTEPSLDPQHRLQTGAYVLTDHWVLESNGGLAGAAYRWFAETFTDTEPRYDWLEQEATAALAGQVVAVLGPQIADFSRLRFPPASIFRFPFIGALERPVGRGEFARAILENVAYAIRGNLEQIEEVAGRSVKTLYLCGGLARSHLLSQLVADVCQQPVRVPVVREATWLGTAICAAMGTGAFPSLQEAVQAMVGWEPDVEPSPAARHYRRLYTRWRELLDQAYSL